MKESRWMEWKEEISFGENLSFEELPSDRQDLAFESFSRILQEKLKIQDFNTDILKTLGFYTKKEELNHAAELFSDDNSFPGIDLVRFGSNISEILDRETFSNGCILEEYENAVRMFEKYYQFERIDGMERQVIERIPVKAFREALANAVVHRVWDIPSHIRVAMYSDKIEIYSPGGLPMGITKKEYLSGYISRLRNPVIANVFFRMQLIEVFGTGIRRIMDCYTGKERKPGFQVMENNICVILPTTDQKRDVSSDESAILEILSAGLLLSSGEIVEKSGFGKNKTVRLLNSLLEKNYIRKVGNGRGTKYGL